MADDLDTTIREAATGPKRASVDGQSVEGQPLKDVIDADRYLAAKKAVKSKNQGIRITKLVPPGAA